MFLLSAHNNCYIILSSYVERHLQKNSSLNFMPLVGFQASKIWIFFWKIYCGAFSGRNNSLMPTFFDFLTVFHMVWKNQENCESWLVGFWVGRRSKMQKKFYQQFWRAISPNPYKILHWNFHDYHILHIVTTWQIFIKFWDGSCPGLHHLTWNDPEVMFFLICKSMYILKVYSMQYTLR